MPVTYNDGSDRSISSMYYHDGSAVRDIQQAWYHDGTAVRLVFTKTNPNPGTVSASNIVAEAIGRGTATTAGLRISGRTLYKLQGTSALSVSPNWLTADGTPSDFEARLTINSATEGGTNIIAPYFDSTNTAGVWYNLGSQQDWFIRVDRFTPQTVYNGTYDIRRVSTGSIEGTNSFSFTSTGQDA